MSPPPQTHTLSLSSAHTPTPKLLAFSSQDLARTCRRLGSTEHRGPGQQPPLRLGPGAGMKLEV